MGDIFKFDPPLNQSQAYGYVATDKDGVVELTIECSHEGNGNGTPFMTADIFVDDIRVLHRRTAWKDGSVTLTASEPFNVVQGRSYKIYGTSENQHATATLIKLSAKRIM